ncbi:MAG: hypothetical protein R3B45_11540 [Bdellovibrionota bacterium]
MLGKFGLLGHHISYSLSPVIHRFSAGMLNLPVSYDLFDIPQSSLESFISSFQLEGQGLNITTPHKSAVARMFSIKNKSINTLYKDDDGNWCASSTDGSGFIQALSHIDRSLEDFDAVLILGSGGVVFSLIEAIDLVKPGIDIKIYRRNKANDSGLTEVVKRIDFSSLSLGAISQDLSQLDQSKVLMVQATSGPLRGDPLEYLVPCLKTFDGTFVDLTYGSHSALLDYSRKNGICNQDGLPMLIEQARLAQELWWKRSVPYRAIWEHLKL